MATTTHHRSQRSRRFRRARRALGGDGLLVLLTQTVARIALMLLAHWLRLPTLGGE
jgi:hypothetical protein